MAIHPRAEASGLSGLILVISICKYKDCNDIEFIEISYYDFDYKGKFVNKMPFPGFKKGEYYEGMEPDKHYKPSELGL